MEVSRALRAAFKECNTAFRDEIVDPYFTLFQEARVDKRTLARITSNSRLYVRPSACWLTTNGWVVAVGHDRCRGGRCAHGIVSNAKG